MMKLFKDQFLKLVGRFALLRVNTGLFEQSLSIDFGLRQQQPKADVFRRQKLLGRRCAGSQRAPVLNRIDFKHTQL